MEGIPNARAASNAARSLRGALVAITSDGLISASL